MNRMAARCNRHAPGAARFLVGLRSELAKRRIVSNSALPKGRCTRYSIDKSRSAACWSSLTQCGGIISRGARPEVVMRAAVMEAVRKPLVVKEMPDPSCPPNGVLLRAEAEGICRSDWHAWSGDWAWIGLTPPMPLVMGHEFCGVIEEVGKDVHNFKKGDRVLVPFSQGDGICLYCRSGQSHVCDNPSLPGFSYWGGYGRYVGIPNVDTNLVPMPEGVGFL